MTYGRNRISLAAVFTLSGSVAACTRADSPKPAPPPPGQRNEAVEATGTMATAAPVVSVAPHPAEPAVPHKLCEGLATDKGRALPKGGLSHAEGPGSPSLGESLPPPAGRWTWVNLWAAWCGPCKEEIPRLKGWEAKLAQTKSPIHMVFMSLDDDQRQLMQFLASQPSAGVRSTYWLPDGPSRSLWLTGMKIKNPPELPKQALLDPAGILRCVIDGAVDDSDYPQVAAIVGSLR